MIRYFTLFFLISISTYAQKVKYKDLITLLNARQYDQAEPFLKRYLKENDDNPNAHLFMGLIFQEKSGKQDLLLKTEDALSLMDSSLIYYDKAYKEIDEREIKKNSEYYESYSRRDLRTGKFGVKLSDVQLDIENRSKGIKERKERVRLLKKYFTTSEAKYAASQNLYKTLLDNYGNQKEFFLRSDEAMIGSLQQLQKTFDSCVLNFNNYKSTSQLLGKTGHNQIINLQAIKDMKRDGHSKADFLNDDLAIWDYSGWAQSANHLIESEIVPIREHLIKYDIEINALRDKLKTDSVSVKFDLAQLSTKLQKDKLRKYDPDPMPMDVFEMKIVELNYVSDMIANKKWKDSTNVGFRLNCVRTELDDIYKLDSVATKLLNRNWDEEMKNYSGFIKNSFGTLNVLKSLTSSTLDFAKRERLKKEKIWEQTMQSLKWELADGDSIPLFKENPGKDYNLKLMSIVEEDFTTGLKYADSLAVGYLFTITPARIPDVKAFYPVDQKRFKKRDLPVIKGLSVSDGAKQVFFSLIYSEAKVDGKFPCTLAKIYRSDGLAWSINYGLDMLPTELQFSGDTGELSIKTSLSGESKVVVFDKNGKQIQ